MHERFTDRARRVMQLANQEAHRFNHEYIGTEHILLGLVREDTGVAVKVLKNLDIDLRKVRLEVEKIVQAGPDMVVMGKRPMTPRAKRVIELAIEESRNLSHADVGPEHLLLGLLREGEVVAAHVLMTIGLESVRVREEILVVIARESTGSPPKAQSGPPDESFSEKPMQSFLTSPQPVDMPSELPLRVALAMDWLAQLIDVFGAMKQDAVCRQDFERAAGLRDQEKKLRKIKEWLRRNKDYEPPETGIIDLS